MRIAAWVMCSEPGHGRRFVLANAAAAWDIDMEDRLAGFNTGMAYLFDVEFTCPFSRTEGGELPEYQALWNPAGSERYSKERREATRRPGGSHLWSCRGATVEGSPLTSRTPDGAPLLVEDRMTRFYDKRHGAVVGPFPWGCWHLWVGGLLVF